MKEGEVDLKSITEEAKIENIAVITDFVNSILEANGCSAKVQTFIDKGIPYHPLENKDPDVTLDIEKRKIGGLGIFLVKEMMDEVSYEYADGKNILKLKKNL